MSMTKREFHDEICAMFGQHPEEEYFASMEAEINEKEIEWFPEYKLAFDGYEEIEPEPPRILIDDDIPF